jgi:hypothetical protein
MNIFGISFRHRFPEGTDQSLGRDLAVRSRDDPPDDVAADVLEAAPDSRDRNLGESAPVRELAGRDFLPG